MVMLDCAAAERRIRPHVIETPVVRSDSLSARSRGQVYLKLENLQETGSFKPRGATHKLLSLTPAQAASGVVAASSGGNHALAVAAAAARLGIAAEVFNRSPHRQEVANLVARMGEPTVRIAAEGITLPRPVRVIFGWQQGWRSYRVTCDLVARLFDCEPVAGALNGKLEPPLGPLRGNAHLVDGRLVAGVRS